jgi:hypothetical protein
MVKILNNEQTFYFSDLTGSECRIVDEFQRQHPLISKATSGIPAFRTFTWSTPEELQLLKQLSEDVSAEEK